MHIFFCEKALGYFCYFNKTTLSKQSPKVENSPSQVTLLLNHEFHPTNPAKIWWNIVDFEAGFSSFQYEAGFSLDNLRSKETRTFR
jgi:hypothetical protein